jgi:RNA polymerase sigma-70 factor (ECF subfamily)
MEKEEHFSDIYKENKDKIYRICCFYARDDEDRKDLFQDVLTNIWRGLDLFEGRSKISTWIYRIAVNTSMAYFKNQNREINKREVIGQEISYSYDNPSNENEQEAINRLHQAISNLNKMEKAIVSLMLEDVSQREIAHILGFTENNIRVKIHRIKKRLKSILKPEVHGY